MKRRSLLKGLFGVAVAPVPVLEAAARPRRYIKPKLLIRQVFEPKTYLREIIMSNSLKDIQREEDEGFITTVNMTAKSTTDNLVTTAETPLTQYTYTFNKITTPAFRRQFVHERGDHGVLRRHY